MIDTIQTAELAAMTAKMNAEIARLQKENAAANKRIEELFKEKKELERKYNLLRYGSED